MKIFKRSKFNKDEYISLSDASKLCDYSQDYLSLRARQDKLESIKIGRNWMTTRKWLDDYIKKTDEYKKNNSSKNNESKILSRNFLSLFLITASLLFIMKGTIAESFSSIIDSQNVVSINSSDGFISKIINNSSDVVKNTSDKFYFKFYKSVTKIDEKISSIKESTLGLLNNFEGNFDKEVASVDSTSEVNFKNNIIGGFKSSLNDIKNYLSNDDSLEEYIKDSDRYSEKINFSELVKANVDTFSDYGQWLSGELKIFEGPARVMDRLIAFGKKAKDKIAGVFNKNLTGIEVELVLVNEGVTESSEEPNNEEVTIINQPIREVQTIIKETVVDNSYVDSSLAFIWEKISNHDEILQSFEKSLGRLSVANSSAPVYINQGLQVGGNGVFDSLNSQIGSFTNLGVGESLTVGDSNSNDSFTSNAISTFNDNVLISGSNAYLSFGTTIGSSGYGIRNNGGTMEYKNDSGSWVGIGSGGSATDTYWIITGSTMSATSSVSYVGIGTSTPSYTLDVNGTFRTTGTSTLATTTISSLTLDSSLTGILRVDSGVVSTTTAGVTSVAMTVPTGLTVSGSPITDSGTFALSYDTGYEAIRTASTTQWMEAYGWGDHSLAGYLTSVAYTDLIGNPSDVITAGTGLSWSTDTLNFSSVGLTWEGNPITNAYIASSTEFLVDTDTTYSATGTLLGLTGTEFGINEGILTNGRICTYVSGTGIVCDTTDAGGTVTSVAMTVPTGLTVSGSPITDSGTFALSYDTGYEAVRTASTTQWMEAYGWGDHSLAGYLTSVPDLYIKLTGDTTGDLTEDLNIDSNTLVVDYDANSVGIGTNTPSYTLDVNGTLGVSGTSTLATTTISNLTVAGNTLLEGINRYLNFGTTAGLTGYGIRDNSGTLEFKNSSGDWTVFRDVYTHVLDNDSWEESSGTLPGALTSSQTAVIGDYVYLFGGGYGFMVGATSTIYRAPTSDPTSWTDTGSTLPGALANSQTAVIGDYVYLFGGYSNGPTSTIYRAPTSDPTSWTDTGSTLPEALANSQTAVIGDYVYLFGGILGGSVNIIYHAPVSDPTSWEDTGSTLPGALSFSQTAVIGDYVYLFGGSGSSGLTSTIYYAPTLDPTSWTDIGSTLPGTLVDSQLAVIGDYVYLFGGADGSYATTTIYLANITSGTASTATVTTHGGMLTAKGWKYLPNSNTSSYFTQNGNTFGASAVLGTNDNYGLTLETNGTGRLTITSTGNVGIGTSTPSYTLDVNGTFRTTGTSTLSNVLLEGSSRYLNFGTTAGSTGYGIRDNSGTLEFKNSSGGWMEIGIGRDAYTYVLDNDSWETPSAILPKPLGAAQLATIGDYVYLFGGWDSSSVTSTIYRASTSDPTSWTDTGSTLPAGLSTSQTAVIGDYVYLFGGYDGNNATSIIYRAPTSDPTSWTNTGSTLPGALDESQLAVIGDYVYLFGGYDASGYTTSTIYRAPTSDPTSWTDTGSTLPGAISTSQTAVIGTYVYLFGGGDNNSPTSTIYRAPTSDPTSWTDTGSTLLEAAYASQTAVIGDYVYLFGGYSNGPTSTIYRAPTSDPTSWIDIGSTLPGFLAYSQVSVIGNYVYLFGGSVHGSLINTIYRAPTSDPTSWTGIGSTLPGGLGVSQTAVIGDYVYLFGGYDASGYTTSTIYRAPTSDPTSWTDTGSTLPGAISTSQTAVIGTYVYLFGGYDSNSPTSTIYRAPTSDPTSWTDTGGTLPGFLMSSQVAVIGDYVYLFGGYPSGDIIYRAPTSDPTSWTDTGSTLPGNIANSQLAVIGDFIYLFGGRISGSYADVIYIAPISDPTSWEDTGNTLPGVLANSQLAVIGDYVYLFGGSDSPSATTTIYRAPTSDPTSWTDTGNTLPEGFRYSQTAVIGDYIYLFGGWDSSFNSLDTIYSANITPGIDSTATVTTHGGMLEAKGWKYLPNFLSFAQGGNTFGATAVLGTNDNYGLTLETNGTGRLIITSTGDVGIGTLTPVTKLDILDNTASTAQLRLTSDASNYGELYIDSIGNLSIDVTGDTINILDQNVGICSEGSLGAVSCPITGYSITGTGNLIVENTVVAENFERICPDGYIWVPGSAKYGTMPGFCVMKYEARDANTDGFPDSDDPTISPWVMISQESARAECASLGEGYHLISEAEWMTIADNIISTPINDLDDDAGIQLATGHSDSSPTSTLTATTASDPVVSGCNLRVTMENAANAYVSSSCEIRGNGTNDEGYYGTGEAWSTTGYVSGAANKSQLRTHVLSNGEVIWDIAGNIRELTDQLSTIDEQPYEIGSPGTEWLEYTADINYGGFTYLRPADDGWNSANGIGLLYTNKESTATAVRIFIRGGGWTDTDISGIFSLNLFSAPTDTYNWIGFRCAK